MPEGREVMTEHLRRAKRVNNITGRPVGGVRPVRYGPRGLPTPIETTIDGAMRFTARMIARREGISVDDAYYQLSTGQREVQA